MAMIATALTHDQALRSAYATGRPIQRNRLVQDKVGAHLKRLLNVRFAIYQREGNAAFIGFPLAQLAQNQGAVGHVVTVNQQGIILSAQQDVAGLVSIVGEIQVDIGRIQNSAYRTMYFRVVAEEERL